MCSAVCVISGSLNIGLLRSSVDAVVARHESLRTTILENDGRPLQRVRDPCIGETALQESTCLARDGSDLDDAARSFASSFTQQCVDPITGPLFKASVASISKNEHILVLAADHLISDGSSLSLIYDEVWTYYFSVIEGRQPSLPDLPIQYGDYAVWQQQTYEAWLCRHGAYWRQRLAGAPHIQLPVEGAAAGADMSDYVQTHYELGEEISEGLRGVAKRAKLPLPLVVLAVYILTASRWREQDDLVLTFVSNARYRPQVRGMVGYLASQVYLRVQLRESATFLDLVRQVAREFYGALSHEAFDRVIDILPEWRSPGTQLHFNWLPAFPMQRDVRSTRTLSVRSVPFLTTWPADFLPWFGEYDGGVHLIVCHLPRRISVAAVEDLVELLRRVARESISCF